MYAKLKLTLTYQPGEMLVRATIKPGLNTRKGIVSEAGLGQCAHVLTNRTRLAVV
jgi:hypothetical protein